MRHPLARLVSLALVAIVIAPSAFFLTPPKAHAIGPVVVVGDTAPTTFFRDAKLAISAIANVATRASTYALVVDKYVLEPIAFVESGNLLKSLTSGVIQFVDGQANGTGIPQFVTNLSAHIQGVQDAQAYMFFNQFAAQSNSPFAGSIISSLDQQYLQSSNLNGFFAANQCTLGNYSSNVNGYLAGNWSQGGLSEWFALTTQPQNNPFMLYDNAQAELSQMTENAVSNSLTQLLYNNGYLSWCGAASSGSILSAGQVGAAGVAASAGTCTNADGTPGTVETPGSVISAALNKALGSTVDKIVQMGNVAPEINKILGSVSTVMNTLSFGQQLLGGSNSGGLMGAVAATGASGASPVSQYTSQQNYLGVSNQTVVQNSNTSNAVQDIQSRINQYQSSWQALGGAIQNANTSVNNLITQCSQPLAPGMQYSPQAANTLSEARSAMTNEVQPAMSQLQQAQTTISNAQNALNQLKSASSGSTNAQAASYVTTLSQLENAPPTASDVANAQQQASSIGNAQANPTGSLNVSATTLLDKMNLIAQNAAAMQNTCQQVPSTYYGGGGGGAGAGA